MLSPNLLPLLRRYWKLYQLQSWLFPGPRVTEPITPAGVAHICTQAGHAATLKKAVYPHLLRHYADTRTMPSEVGEIARVPFYKGSAQRPSRSCSA